MDGPAICTKPSERARNTTTSPRGVGKPRRAQYFPRDGTKRQKPLGSSRNIPFFKKNLGLCHIEHHSLLSPSLPMLVTARRRRARENVENALKTVVFPAFCLMPAMQTLLKPSASRKRFIKNSDIDILPFLEAGCQLKRKAASLFAKNLLSLYN